MDAGKAKIVRFSMNFVIPFAGCPAPTDRRPRIGSRKDRSGAEKIKSPGHSRGREGEIRPRAGMTDFMSLLPFLPVPTKDASSERPHGRLKTDMARARAVPPALPAGVKNALLRAPTFW